MSRPFDQALREARRTLVLGIGGGGDVVGALALARLSERLGTPAVLAGVTWERIAVDPYPGPRSIEQIVGGTRIGDAAVLISPDEGAATPEGVEFSESRLARHLGAETVLVDVSRGAARAAAGVEAAARELDCDLILFVDVGGDVLATGTEPGLGSPLCDAVMLAAAQEVERRLARLACVLGPGCDGELTTEEVIGRVAAIARSGGWLGTASVTAEVADELERAARANYTEASLQLARCARGEVGEAPIREGRRSVTLGPLGALCLFLDADVAYRMSSLAQAVRDAPDIIAGRDALAAIGVRTELDFERTRLGEGS